MVCSAWALAWALFEECSPRLYWRGAHTAISTRNYTWRDHNRIRGIDRKPQWKSDYTNRKATHWITLACVWWILQVRHINTLMTKNNDIKTSQCSLIMGHTSRKKHLCKCRDCLFSLPEFLKSLSPNWTWAIAPNVFLKPRWLEQTNSWLIHFNRLVCKRAARLFPFSSSQTLSHYANKAVPVWTLCWQLMHIKFSVISLSGVLAVSVAWILCLFGANFFVGSLFQIKWRSQTAGWRFWTRACLP